MACRKLLTGAAGALALAVVAGGAEAAPGGVLKAPINAENASAVEKVTWRSYRYGYRPYSYYRPYYYSYHPYKYRKYSYYRPYKYRKYSYYRPYKYSYYPYYYRGGFGRRHWW
jgi:hypothetical protein